MSRAFALRHVFQDAAETTGNGTVLNVAGLARLGIQVSYAALASASASPSASPSESPSASPSLSPSASASASASKSASPSASASATGSPSLSASASASATASPSLSQSLSLSPSTSPSAPPTGAGGTVDFECTIDGSTWYALACTPSVGGTAVINTAAPGLWLVTVAGLSLVRCRITDIVTGSITVSGIGTVARSEER